MSPYSTAKTNFKSTHLRKIGNKWYKSSSVCFTILGEKPYEEVLDYDSNFYKNIARNDGFLPAPEIDFRFDTNARNVMVDFKFDALYR